MGPIQPSQFTNQPMSHHPYAVPPASQLAAAAQDPKLAGLKVVPSVSGRSSVGSSASAGARLESVPLSYPPVPAADPRQLLANVAKGLESLIDRGTIDARPSRQGVAAPRVGACAACREAKAKCSQGETCTRCLANNTPCLYPLFAKRGRKRTLTPNMILLESLHRDVERAVKLISSANSPARGGSTSPHSTSPFASSSSAHGLHRQLPKQEGESPATDVDEDDEADEARDGFETVIESPLAVLAHLSSLKLNESNDEESGSSFLPSGTQNPTAPEGYFATGLYQQRADCEPMLDPILLGLLTEADLDRLVNLYFNSLHEFCWHLDRNIHTPRFLRDTSPFLTTAVALTAAGFCPHSGHLLPGLQGHAMYLSDRIFSEGLKSLEIVQAYCLLVHWAPIANNWGDDRRWGWLGQALRIATEIRMDKPLNELTFNHYNTVTVVPPGSFAALARDRARSWTLLFIAEIALCVSTGRLGAIVGLNLGKGFRAHVPTCEPGDADYNLCAMEALNKVYAKALALSAGLQEESASARGSDLRQAFNSSWQSEMESWRQNWQHASQFVRVVYQHSCTILLSVSLRFKGPVGPVLDECRAYANVTVRLAAEWPNANLAYASNILVVNIAYAATLILRIACAPGQRITPTERTLCAKVSDVLGTTGQVRPHCRTLGALHSVRIRTLLNAPHAAPDPSTASSHSSASNSGNSTPSSVFTSSNPNLGLPQTGRPMTTQLSQLRTPNQATYQLNPAPRLSPGGSQAGPLSGASPTTAAAMMTGLVSTAPLMSGGVVSPPSSSTVTAGGFATGLTPPGVMGQFDQGPALWDFFGGADWNQSQPNRVMLPQVAGPGMVVQHSNQGPIEWSGEWSQSEPGTWAW